jgi:hypothetical protein
MKVIVSMVAMTSCDGWIIFDREKPQTKEHDDGGRHLCDRTGHP